MKFNEDDPISVTRDAMTRILESDDFIYLRDACEFLKVCPFEQLELSYKKYLERTGK